MKNAEDVRRYLTDVVLGNETFGLHPEERVEVLRDVAKKANEMADEQEQENELHGVPD